VIFFPQSYIKIVQLAKFPQMLIGQFFNQLGRHVNGASRKTLEIQVYSEIMVDTDYFFDVSFKTFRLVLEPSSVEI